MPLSDQMYLFLGQDKTSQSKWSDMNPQAKQVRILVIYIATLWLYIDMPPNSHGRHEPSPYNTSSLHRANPNIVKN